MKAKTKRRITRKQTEAHKKRLLARRSRLLRGLQSQLEALRQADQRRVSDTADVANDAVLDFQSLQVAEVEVQELRKIDGAIRRIDAGAFDVCEECDGPIGRQRLRALPQATLCIRCQQRLERGGALRPQEEHWGGVVETEMELESAGRTVERLDGVERRY